MVHLLYINRFSLEIYVFYEINQFAIFFKWFIAAVLNLGMRTTRGT